MSAQKALIIYHANCLDGFTAAWIAEGTLSQVMDTELYPAKYKQDPPYDLVDNTTQVYIVDFSYPPKELRELASQAAAVVLLDHHKSAFEQLGDFSDPNVQVILDNNRSGAGIAWTFFNGNKPMPKLVAHVQDRDLWQFKLTDTKAITEAMYAREFDLAAWDEMAAIDSEELAQEGYTLLRKKELDIAHWVKHPLMVSIAGHVVPLLNVPAQYSSDVGHALHTQQPEAGFAGTYQDVVDEERGLIRVYSLRSSDAGMDVSLIARKFGGGGHRNAAGFSVAYAAIDQQGSPKQNVDTNTIEWNNPLEETQALLERALEKLAEARNSNDEGDS